MKRPVAGGGQRTRAEEQSSDNIKNYTTALDAHLAALAELETVGQYADYLFWQSRTADMQRQLLAHVPANIRGSVWARVMDMHRAQRTGGW